MQIETAAWHSPNSKLLTLFLRYAKGLLLEVNDFHILQEGYVQLLSDPVDQLLSVNSAFFASIAGVLAARL